MRTRIRNRHCSTCGKQFTVKLNRRKHIDPNKYFYSPMKLPKSDRTVIVGKTKDGNNVYDCPDGWRWVEYWECTKCLTEGPPSRPPSKAELEARKRWETEGRPKFTIEYSPQVAAVMDERWSVGL